MLEVGEHYETLVRECDDAHANYEAIRKPIESPTAEILGNPGKPITLWEGRQLHPDTSPHQIAAIRNNMQRRVGAKLLTLLAGSDRPWFITARILEQRTPSAAIDVRIIIILSEQKIDPTEAELLAINPPPEGENKL